MTIMRFIKKVPASLIGVGGPYQPGQEYPLPDITAAGLIVTNDPDWEAVKPQKNHSDETHAPNGEGSQNRKGRK